MQGVPVGILQFAFNAVRYFIKVASFPLALGSIMSQTSEESTHSNPLHIHTTQLEHTIIWLEPSRATNVRYGVPMFHFRTYRIRTSLCSLFNAFNLSLSRALLVLVWCFDLSEFTQHMKSTIQGTSDYCAHRIGRLLPPSRNSCYLYTYIVFVRLWLDAVAAQFFLCPQWNSRASKRMEVGHSNLCFTFIYVFCSEPGSQVEHARLTWSTNRELIHSNILHSVFRFIYLCKLPPNAAPIVE